jgi:rubrerythrin
MAAKYNAFEVLLIAEQVERNGAEFYRKAAGLFEKEKLRELFFDLAEWEDKHEKTFAEMKRQVKEGMTEVRFFDCCVCNQAKPSCGSERC